VSRVAEDSLCFRAGLRVGDKLVSVMALNVSYEYHKNRDGDRYNDDISNAAAGVYLGV